MRALICSGDSTRTRAAASSMASGIPSSARQIAATSAALPGPSVNPGRDAAARSANRRMASNRCASLARRSASSGATASGGTSHAVSAAMRSGSRLVLSNRSPGELASSRWPSCAHASIRCSQLSSASSSRRGRSASASVSSSGRPGSSLTPMTAATREATSSGWRRSASSTNQAPSGNSSAVAARIRSASRVFPIPPGPHRVSARARRSIRPASAISRSRPMKLFGSWGSWAWTPAAGMP